MFIKFKNIKFKNFLNTYLSNIQYLSNIYIKAFQGMQTYRSCHHSPRKKNWIKVF